MGQHWVHLKLDVSTFDVDAFRELVEDCRTIGIAFATMADLGDSPRNHRLLYELNRTCSADIPGRGEFYSFEEYCAERIKTESYNASTAVVARDGDEWVGMSTASDHRHRGFFFNEMTGVLRSHRGLGIAKVMKVLVIARVQELGVPTIRTIHHPDNEAPIALNRRLGYVDDETPPTAAP